MLSSGKNISLFKTLYPNQSNHLQAQEHHLQENNQNSMYQHHVQPENQF
jgi:hypothetical protein